MNAPNVNVTYSCDKCGLKDKQVDVQECGTGEDLMDWMNRLVYALSRDHDTASPGCRVASLSEVKIPLAHHDSHIGKAERH